MTSKFTDYISTQGLDAFKHLCYAYSQNFKHSCILDSCQLNTGVHGGNYEFLAAYGAEEIYTSYVGFQNAIQQKGNWLFGVLGYDVKNHIENLSSKNDTIIDTTETLFFVPQIVVAIDKGGNLLELKGKVSDDIWESTIENTQHNVASSYSPISKEIYLQKISQIHELIREGNVYELNYCVPFTHSFTSFSPLFFHQQLIKKSPVPMAAYLRADHLHLCGASMERFLLKKGNKLISQPIKGTIRKGDNPQEDQRLIQELENSEKDKAENVMIVDLVRNDLNRICERRSVHVPELFGIYSYLQVHQMISTVEGTVAHDKTLLNILEATFPMGSMTGAPKIAAMQQIEQLENFKRGWYSGAVGYITPDQDFDFNVVIRTVLCNTKSKTLNYNAGGAITIDSVADSEWKEVKLKTKAITSILKP
ncbi:MAG: para-aminobenzoate synthetase component 1 [Bacteroidia bacterium]